MKNIDDEAAERFLAQLGLTVFTAQALEYTMTSLFAATELANTTHEPVPIDLKELMDARYRQTLGTLIREAGHYLQLDPDLIEDLEDALHERNWLIHHSYREFAPASFDDELRDIAIDKLKRARKMFEEVSDTIGEITISRILETGVSRSEVMKGIEKATQEYIKEMLSENAT